MINMNNINLNSPEWCELIFNGKNKDYGAYELRKNSSGRHIRALIIVAIGAILVMTIPALIKSVIPARQRAGTGCNDTFQPANGNEGTGRKSNP